MALFVKFDKKPNQDLKDTGFRTGIPNSVLQWKIWKLLRLLQRTRFPKNTEDWKYLPKYYPFKFGWQKTMPFNPKWQERDHVLTELTRLGIGLMEDTESEMVLVVEQILDSGGFSATAVSTSSLISEIIEFSGDIETGH